jgi:hypothetical protein
MNKGFSFAESLQIKKNDKSQLPGVLLHLRVGDLSRPLPDPDGWENQSALI